MKKNVKKLLSFAVLAFIIFFEVSYLGMTIAATGDTVKVPILLYHHINPIYPADTALANLTPEEFRLHMRTLIAQNYDFISLRQYMDYVLYNTALPPKPVVITFDDGYESNFTHAFPILQEFNIPATIFIVTETVGMQTGDVLNGNSVNFPHFTWEQAAEMEASGLIDIQSHGNKHQRITRMSLSDMQIQLRRSKFLIETKLNKTCDMFAYPYGDYSAASLNIARQAGIKAQILVSDNVGDINEVNVKSEGLESLKRLTVYGHMSNFELLNMIDEAMAG